MTKHAALLLTLGALLLVTGVGLWSIPSALVVAGVLVIAAGVLALDDTALRQNRGPAKGQR